MTKSHENYKYFVTWIDNKSRKVFIDGIKVKSEVMDHLKMFVEHAEVKPNCHVIALRSDGGGEYIAGTLQQYLKDKGIKHEMITPDRVPRHSSLGGFSSASQRVCRIGKLLGCRLCGAVTYTYPIGVGLTLRFVGHL